MNPLNRRKFLKYAALAGAGSVFLPSFDLMKKNSIGIQLYTLRDLLTDNPRQVLEKLGDIGYKEVESFGYANGLFFGMNAKEYKKALSDSGLKGVSGHYGTGRFNPDQKGSLNHGWLLAIDDAAEVGQKYMVLAWLHPDERKSIDDYKKLTELLNKCGEECKKRNIQFAYHNHDFEFIPLDGQVPYDIILSETDPDLVQMELDLYWASKVNLDVVNLFEKNPGRYPLFHVKDMDKNGDFAAVGTGTIDFSTIFEHRDTAGLKHFFVEQDQITGNKWENVETSYRNIQEFI